MDPDIYLLRYDEIGLKSSWVRKKFEHRLMDNIRAAFQEKGIESTVKRGYGRIFVETDSSEKAEEILSRIFGLVSFSPAVTLEADLDKIVKRSGEMAVNYIDADASFAVRARRVGEHDFSSKDLEREVGSKVVEVTGASVDLDDPDKILYIEVRQNKCYIFKEKLEAPGGLPLGTQGKVVSLFRGDLNSFLATWLLMKRGCEVIPVYCDVRPYVNEKQEDKLKESLRELEKYYKGAQMSSLRFDFGQQYFELIENSNKRLAYLVFKRLLYRVAAQIARKEGAKAIVTGETGNQSYETFQNMALLDKVIDIPSLRPLVGFDRNEIAELGKELASDALLERIECQAYPKDMEDFAVEEIEKFEAEIDIEAKVKEIVERIYNNQ